MTVAEVLKCADGDAGAIEIQEGKRYLIFVDAYSIDLRDLGELPALGDSEIQFVVLLPPSGSTVGDCVKAFELPVSE